MTTFRVVSNIGGLTQLCGPFTGSELKEGQWEEEKIDGPMIEWLLTK